MNRRTPGLGGAAAAVLPLLGALVLPFAGQAQQFVVDDAAIVDLGHCHMEAWHGERSSWILPACQAFRNIELAAGAGFVTLADGTREVEHAIELKTLLRPLAPDDWGVGLVLGVGPNPSAAPEQRRFGDVYAFVPVSLSLADDAPVLHVNVGWEWDREGDRSVQSGGERRESHHSTWGGRADVALSERISFLGEVYGEDDARPEYQIGVRTHLPEAGVEMDVSWGGSLEEDARGAGLTVGFQFVSGRIFGRGGS